MRRFTLVFEVALLKSRRGRACPARCAHAKNDRFREDVTSATTIRVKVPVRRIPSLPCCVLTIAFLTLFFPSLGTAQSPTPAEAIALEQKGNLEAATTAWRSIIKQNPRDAAAFANLGVVLAKQQKYPEAAAAYKKALALNPKLPGIQLNLGLAEFKQGLFAAAIAPLKTAAAQDPGSVQARLLLGMSYCGAKKFDDAADSFELSIKSDPENSELHHLLAHSCLWAKKYSCAQEQFQWIQQKEPDSAAAHMLLGEALDGLGRTPEAISEFQAATKIDPGEPNANFGLGYLYWKLRQYDQAIPAFESELSAHPDHAQSLAYLGDTEMKKDDTEKSAILLKKAVQLNTGIRIAHADLGAIYAGQKRYQDALAEFQAAVKLDPDQPDTHFRLGRLYQAMGNSSAAQQEFARVQELHKKTEDDLLEKMSGAPPPLKP